ncbi:hypothetical protein Lepto7375DRAFT_6363 [Leptolyngbya sp. PCC 7375]|nr:hypothetical protein Lepto7375DRAFT_6363 [Leptolyngbya sp. PCC 7375]
MRALLQKLFNRQPSSVNQMQREAMVDLCLLGMYSDSRLSIDEQDFLDEEFNKLTWESGISLGSYLQRAVPRVRSVIDDAPELAAFLQDIAQRLGEGDFRQTAMDALQELLESDGVAESESKFMADVRKALTM